MPNSMSEEDAVRQFASAFLNLVGAIRSTAATQVASELKRLLNETQELNGSLHRTPAERKPILLSAREAAKSLSVSQRTLWNLTAPRGPIPSVKLGTRVCYAVQDLEQAIQQMKSNPEDK